MTAPRATQRPIIIGVTGGIGAGKSTLVDAFARRGAVVFSADAAVHELYGRPDVIDAVRARWGDQVIAEDGTIARSAIAAIVFTNADERAWLESLLHPLVADAWERFVAHEHARDAAPELIVAEVPLLYEAGLEGRYDAVVAIVAPHATRMERIAARDDGRTLPEQRSAAQMRQREKAERADYVYENTGSLEELDAFAAHVITQLHGR